MGPGPENGGGGDMGKNNTFRFGESKMKIAITAKGKGSNLDSEVDQRFGRAEWIIVVDTETGQHQVHDNSLNLNAPTGAGVQTASNIAELGVDAVITGNVGPKAYRTLTAADIDIYLVGQSSVKEAVDKLKAEKIKPIDRANVEAHWI